MEFHQNRYARELRENAFPGCRWLDLGAGTRLHGGWLGPPQEALASLASSLIGCDLLSAHLRANPLLTFRLVATGERLPFADCSFDLVSANMVLEHLPDPVGVFREIARVLVPGGRFVFVTPNRGHPAVALAWVLLHSAYRQKLAVLIERRPLAHVFHTYYRANCISAILSHATAAGLAVVRLDRFCSLPFTAHFPVVRPLERRWIALTERQWAAGLRSNILGVLERLGPRKSATHV